MTAAHMIKDTRAPLQRRAATWSRRLILSSVAAAALMIGTIDQISAATFTLTDGAEAQGDIAKFGERYVMLAKKDGGFLIIERDKLSTVTVASSNGPVVGQLNGWNDDGFVLKTPRGDVTIAPEQEADAGLPDTDGALKAEADAAARPNVAARTEATTPTSPSETALAELAAVGGESVRPDAALARAAKLTSTRPERVVALALPHQVRQRPVAATAPTNQTAAQSPAAPTPDDNPGPQTATPSRSTSQDSALASNGPVIISTASPKIDRSSDRLQILTAAPTGTPETASADNQAERKTFAAAALRSPSPSVMTAPGIATPRLAAPAEPTTPTVASQPPRTVASQAASNAQDRSVQREQAPKIATAAPLAGPNTKDKATEGLKPNASGAAAIGVVAVEPGAAPKMDPAPARDSISEPTGDASGVAAAPPVSAASPLEQGAQVRKAQFNNAAAAGDRTSRSAAQPRTSLTQTPSIPGVDPAGVARDASSVGLFEEYKMGVLGPARGREGRISCAQLGATVVPPKPLADNRADPGAMAILIGPEASHSSARRFAARFLSIDAANTSENVDSSNGFSFSITPRAALLSMPDRIVGLRSASQASPFASGSADIAIVGGAPPPGAYEAGRARLIGFDALAFVAHPDAPQDGLSANALRGLFLGQLNDWSMIDPQRVGPALLLLPPDGAAALQATLNYSGARRARPATSRRVSGAGARARAARGTPGAVALTLASAAGDLQPLRIGSRSSGVEPSIDNLRRGAYPLPWPIYVVAPEKPTHASAAVLFEYLSGPRGQRAVFEAGLAPVAACDPSTCALQAKGLSSARERLATPLRLQPLVIRVAAAQAADTPLAQFRAPADLGAPTDDFVSTLASFIASVEPGADIAAAQLSLIVRTGPINGATTQRASSGRVRAEAAALALRCAGLKLEDVVIDPSPVASEAGGFLIELRRRVE